MVCSTASAAVLRLVEPVSRGRLGSSLVPVPSGSLCSDNWLVTASKFIVCYLKHLAASARGDVNPGSLCFLAPPSLFFFFFLFSTLFLFVHVTQLQCSSKCHHLTEESPGKVRKDWTKNKLTDRSNSHRHTSLWSLYLNRGLRWTCSHQRLCLLNGQEWRSHHCGRMWARHLKRHIQVALSYRSAECKQTKAIWF